MLQKPATNPAFSVVPGYSRLFRRGATYYFRISVPQELRKAIGKTEIVRSLRTKNFQDAKRLVAQESTRVDALFASERGKVRPVREVRPPIASLSEGEMHCLVAEWFIGLEKEAEEWWVTTGSVLEPHELKERLEEMRIDQTCHSGGNQHYDAADCRWEVDNFLKERGISLVPESLSYKMLDDLFRRARLETIRRSIDRVTYEPIRSYDQMLENLFAHTVQAPQPRKVTQLGEFLDTFLKFAKESRSETTYMTYQTPVRVMREVLGEQTPLSEITKESVIELFETLKRRPKNAEQRYRGLTTEEAIAEAERRGDRLRLGKVALENYYRNIYAIFNLQ